MFLPFRTPSGRRDHCRLRNLCVAVGHGDLMGDLVDLRRAIVEMFDATETFDQQSLVEQPTQATAADARGFRQGSPGVPAA